MRRLRKPSRRAILLGSATLVVLVCIGLFVRAYRSAGPGSTQAGGSAQAGAGFGAEPSDPPSASATPSASPHTDKARFDGLLPSSHALPKYTFTAAGGPGFTIVPAPTHRLVATVSSSRAIGDVGYLIPTSNDHAYGVARGVGQRWVLRTAVTGKPYYAEIFIQAGATGASITCSISLDGKVMTTRSTIGPYGRQLCVA